MEFGRRQLRDIIAAGRVTEQEARLWIRVERPGRYTIHVEALHADAPPQQTSVGVDDGVDDHTVVVMLPGSSGSGLRPDTAYVARLLADGRCLAAAEFRTAPASSATPREWSFGMFSCHQPFANANGTELEEGASMLTAAREALTTAGARFVLMLGDQMYTDQPRAYSLYDEVYFATVKPERRSLLDCTRAEVRALLHERHRIFWGTEAFRRIQSSFACYPMLDDHEIVDNWGTHEAHGGAAWTTVRDGALDAVYDYQIARVLPRRPDGSRPDAFDHGFAWGNAAIWMMDVRSRRRTHDGRTEPYAPEQLEQLTSFMSRHGDCKLLVIATPVPLIHVEGTIAVAASRFLGAGSDLHERWSHTQCRRARDRLLAAILDHAARHRHQRVLLVGGDVHAGAAFDVQFESGLRFLQFTSSALSNREGILATKAAELAANTCPDVELEHDRARCRLLRGRAGTDRNPFGRLNLGLVDVIDRGRSVDLRLRLVSHDGRGGPRTVFDSGAS